MTAAITSFTGSQSIRNVMYFTTLLSICALVSFSPITGTADIKIGPDTSQQIRAGEIVINEMMVDPDPAAGAVVYPEYIELYNKKAFPIRLKSWKLGVGTTYKLLPDVIIPADSFLVLTSVSGVSVFSEKINVAGMTGFPVLANTGQIVQLLNDSGNIVSAVMYTDEWYQDPFKKEGGYSLEQVDADNPCGGIVNWRASVNGTGGTPGKKNSVAASNSDKSAPQIHHIGVLSPTQLDVYFTEPMDSTTLSDPASYQVETIGTAASANPAKPLYDHVRLTLASPLKENVVYTLSIARRACDCVGNILGGDNRIRVGIPQEANQSDMILNELLFDPKPYGADFVEIFNRSDKIVDLKTIFLCHFDSIYGVVSSVERMTESGYLIFPGEYRVLTENINSVKQQYGVQNAGVFIEVPHLPSLNADKGDIALKTANTLIDFFMYDADMHFGLLHERKGVSLERVSPEKPTNERTNWHSAASTVGFATPGFKNSQYVEPYQSDNVLTIYPEVFTPDNDGKNDLMNVYYQLEEPGWSSSVFIYDQTGRLVRTLANNDLTGTEGNYSWDGTSDDHSKLLPGIYVIYAQLINLSGKINVYKKVCVLSAKN